MTTIEPTELRLNPDYELYYINWFRTIMNAFLPFLLLAFLNGRIIYQFRVSTKISSNRVSRKVARKKCVRGLSFLLLTEKA
jgi:hypothetical protein